MLFRSFNPVARKSEPKLKVELDRVDYWVGKGAQLSERVAALVAGHRKEAGKAVAAAA